MLYGFFQNVQQFQRVAIFEFPIIDDIFLPFFALFIVYLLVKQGE